MMVKDLEFISKLPLKVCNRFEFSEDLEPHSRWQYVLFGLILLWHKKDESSPKI